MLSIALSPLGLERGASISEKNFVFIGNDSELECTTFQAAYISPRVHLMLQEDKTVNSFVIEWETKGIKEKRIFELFERLMHGFSVELSDSEAGDVLKLAVFLGNVELLDRGFNSQEPISASNVCSQLIVKIASGCSVDKEIEFAASHFFEIDLDRLKAVNISVLERILSSEALHLKDEDSLLDFICDVESDCDIVLLRHLRVEYLSCKGMELFLNRLFHPDLDPLIWFSLRRRLILPIECGDLEYSSTAKSRFVGAAFLRRPLKRIDIHTKEDKSYNKDKLLDGIMSYLTKKYGGNVHEKGIVTIASKSVRSCDPMWAVQNLADVSVTSVFVSEDEPGQWVCWDFHEMRVRLTHYTLRSCELQTWVIEASLDAENWTEIDRKTQNQDLRSWRIVTFAVQQPMECRFIRLSQTGKNNGCGDYNRCEPNDLLIFYAAEFFGTLFE
jgi:hypothetical protein